MNTDFKSIGTIDASSVGSQSWVNVGGDQQNLSTNSVGSVEAEVRSVNKKIAETAAAALLVVQSDGVRVYSEGLISESPCNIEGSPPRSPRRMLYTGEGPRDSVDIARERLKQAEIEDKSAVLLDDNLSTELFTDVDTALFTESDFRDLFEKVEKREYVDDVKDRRLEQVIIGLLRDEYIEKDKEIIRKLPIENRSGNIWRVISEFNFIKHARFDVLYRALDLISSAEKKAELRSLIKEAEAIYTLA